MSDQEKAIEWIKKHIDFEKQSPKPTIFMTTQIEIHEGGEPNIGYSSFVEFGYNGYVSGWHDKPMKAAKAVVEKWMQLR